MTTRPSASTPPLAAPRLELRGITKQYPAVRANDGISLQVGPGEIHAVLGENGAGKSTLMKIIYGAVRPDAGELRWNGQPVQVRNPHEARRLGISMVYQHFSLFDTLTAAENVWLGLSHGAPKPTGTSPAPRGGASFLGRPGERPKTGSLAAVVARIREVAGTYGLDVDPLRPVHTLSVGERQRVEIVRALLTNPQLLILDEPTSVLTPQAVEALFVTLRQLADEGCSVLYISHKLDEIRALCHHCTVLRGGRVTGEIDPRTVSNAELSRLMIGAEPPSLQHQARAAGAVALNVRALSLDPADEFGTRLRDIDLQVRAGEIVGVAGVSGNGQQELLAALSGERATDGPRAAPGSIELFGTDIARASARRRRELGLHVVPEERLGRGAVPSLSLADNVLLTRTEALGPLGWIRRATLREQARGLIARFQVKAGGPDAAARSLSGGNLQKFIVGREIEARPRVLIVAQPTWGVDVGAAAQIRGELLRLRDAGCAVLVVSEELDELFEISDRLVVMAQGRVSPSVPTAAATPARIGEWMSGLWPAGANPEVEHHAQA